MKAYLHDHGGRFDGTPFTRQDSLSSEALEARQRMRWERIRRELSREPTLAGKMMGELAIATRREWFHSWLDQPVRAYLDCSYDQLRLLPGFGCHERARLRTILDAVLRNVARSRLPPYSSHAVSAAAGRRLSAWNIPMDYPIDLLSLPARLRFHARQHDCQSLADWIAELAELPLRRHVRNVGPKAIAEGLALIDALAAGDAARVRCWIPVARNQCGLSFAVAMEQLIQRMPAVPRQMLDLNLVAGKTYRESGALLGVSAGRVQQVVRDFRLRVQQLVYYFKLEKTARRFQPAVATDLSFLNETDRALALAALVRVNAQRLEPTWQHPLPAVTYNPDPASLLAAMTINVSQPDANGAMAFP